MHQISMSLFNISKRFITPSLLQKTVSCFKCCDIVNKRYPAFYTTKNSIPYQETIQNTTLENDLKCKETVLKVNNQILNKEHGRLFAVVHLGGKQYRVVEEDILMIEGYWAPQIKDVIHLKKVLLVGSPDFTVIGRPLLPAGVAVVTATVVEKDLTFTRVRFRRIKRKRHRRISFIKTDLTALRINKIQIYPKIDEIEDTVVVDRLM